MNRETGLSRGMGIVKYEEEESYQKALKEMDCFEYEGRKLYVRPYQPHQQNGFAEETQKKSNESTETEASKELEASRKPKDLNDSKPTKEAMELQQLRELEERRDRGDSIYSNDSEESGEVPDDPKAFSDFMDLEEPKGVEPKNEEENSNPSENPVPKSEEQQALESLDYE